jgi:hypothetical protein
VSGYVFAPTFAVPSCPDGHSRSATLAQLAGGSLALVQSAAIVPLTLHFLQPPVQPISSGLFYLLLFLNQQFLDTKNAIETRINPKIPAKPTPQTVVYLPFQRHIMQFFFLLIEKKLSAEALHKRPSNAKKPPP